MRAKCPRSLVKNRRREAASPYHSEFGARRSKDGLGQDDPATMKRLILQQQLNERTFGTKVPAYEEAASSFSSPLTIDC